jgi:sporulation protein YlmC with PRC-barrel domain
MRASDLLDRTVFDDTGHSWGRVHDLHIVQDGPTRASGDAGFRLHGLVAGPTTVGTALGYNEDRLRPSEHQARGPLLLRALVRALHRRTVYVPWEAIVAVEHDRIIVTAPADGFDPA